MRNRERSNANFMENEDDSLFKCVLSLDDLQGKWVSSLGDVAFVKGDRCTLNDTHVSKIKESVYSFEANGWILKKENASKMEWTNKFNDETIFWARTPKELRLKTRQKKAEPIVDENLENDFLCVGGRDRSNGFSVFEKNS